MDYDYIKQGDCLELMKELPDGSVYMVLCDLPYGTTACKWDSVIPFEPLWEQHKRIIKPNGAIVLFGSEPFSSMLRMSNLDWYKYDWIWEKNHCTGFQHAKNMPQKDYECISVFSPGSMGHAHLLGDKRMVYNPQGLIRNPKVYHNGKAKFGGIVGKRPSHKDTIVSEYENYPTTTLYFSKDSNSVHPTQKPVNLLRYLIATYSNEGDLILDNTMGSGSTCVAAIKEHRHFIGYELTEEYFNIAKRRIELEQMQPTLDL